jgi:cell division protein FtsB
LTERQLMFRIKLITSVAVALLVLLAAFICFQLISLRNLRDTEARLERELEVLKRQTQTLEEEIEYRNSRTFIEQYAREKLGLGYSNESRYVFEEEEKE